MCPTKTMYGLVYKEGCDAVTIMFDDTDVFALACHYFPLDRSEEPTKACRTITDIGETAQKHESIILSLLAAHALTGCDSLCCLHSIGKKTAIKVMKQRQLCLLGDT